MKKLKGRVTIVAEVEFLVPTAEMAHAIRKVAMDQLRRARAAVASGRARRLKARIMGVCPEHA